MVNLYKQEQKKQLVQMKEKLHPKKTKMETVLMQQNMMTESSDKKEKVDQATRQYNKNLTAGQLIQSNYDMSMPDYKDKLAKCFELRTKQLKSKQKSHQKNWDEATCNDKNYNMNKKGYKQMLGEIEKAKANIMKFKRGLSVFED